MWPLDDKAHEVDDDDDDDDDKEQDENDNGDDDYYYDEDSDGDDDDGDDRCVKKREWRGLCISSSHTPLRQLHSQTLAAAN